MAKHSECSPRHLLPKDRNSAKQCTRPMQDCLRSKRVMGRTSAERPINQCRTPSRIIRRYLIWIPKANCGAKTGRHQNHDDPFRGNRAQAATSQSDLDTRRQPQNWRRFSFEPVSHSNETPVVMRFPSNFPHRACSREQGISGITHALNPLNNECLSMPVKHIAQ